MELIGTPMHLKVHYAHPDGSSYPKERCPMYATFNEGKIHTIDNEVLWHKDGHPIPVRYTSIPIFEQDIIQGAVVTFMDISKEKAAIDALEELAHFDTLTHLPNRHSFSERLEQTLARAKRQNSYFAILFIDVDNFKDINDVHGHKFGDEVPVNFSIVVA
jgi:hypothetical protein